jgi:hypothetical protein
MIEATLANMRNSRDFFKTDEIIHILDGRKKEDIGFFVPQIFKEEFEKFVEKIEKKKKLTLLSRVAKAQKKDPITEGGISDGIN